MANLHSPLGASQCERNYKCPGSYWLVKRSKELIESEDSTEYSAEGTLAHSIAEGRLREYLAKRSNDERSYRHTLGSFPGCVRRIDNVEVVVTHELLAAVAVYVEFVVNIIERYNLKDKHIKLEEKVSIPHPTTKDLWGKPDAQLIVEGYKLVVVDYKHGAGVDVDVIDNFQLQYYALASFLALPEDIRTDISKVELVIIQPRTTDVDDGIKTWVRSTEQLLDFRKTLDLMVDAVAAAQFEPHNFLNPGYKWCRFCPAKAGCPAIRSKLQKDMGIEFTDVSNVEVKELTGEEISKFLKLRQDAISFFKAIEDRANKMALSGHKIPGFSLQDVLSDREWIDEDEVKRTFSVLGNSLFEVTPPKLLTPTKLESLLKDKKRSGRLSKEEEKLLEYSLKPGSELVQRRVTGKKLKRSLEPSSIAVDSKNTHSDFEGMDLSELVSEI